MTPEERLRAELAQVYIRHIEEGLELLELLCDGPLDQLALLERRADLEHLRSLLPTEKDHS